MSCSRPVLPVGLNSRLQELEVKYTSNPMNGEDEVIVWIKDQVIEACLEYKYAYYMVMHPKWLGCVPYNRGGEGLMWHRAHSRASIIRKSGFSKAAIHSNAVGVEDHPVKKEIAKFTIQLCSVSDRFARYVEEEIKGGTLGAGHANHGFACLHDKVPCLDDIWVCVVITRISLYSMEVTCGH